MIEHYANVHDYINNLIKLSHTTNYDIKINQCLIGCIDMIIDDRMIIIEANCKQKPSITDFVKYLIFWAKYNVDVGNELALNFIVYYNPIIGKTFEWNLTELDLGWSDKIINFFSIR